MSTQDLKLEIYQTLKDLQQGCIVPECAPLDALNEESTTAFRRIETALNSMLKEKEQSK